jgi:hypothetical protein
MRPALKAILFLCPLLCMGWGFFGHQKINRLAVFTLPPEMIGFYKKNIQYITEVATYPDRRRYSVPGEAPRHYIDFEDYGDSALTKLPKYWKEATEQFCEDTLNKRGIVPWHIAHEFNRLKEAFLLNDPRKILRVSAELGHYVADANVPLHTTRNHNGQLTGQMGIHAFWESRLPELFFGEYDFFVGPACHVDDPQAAAWEAVRRAHALVDTVLSEERKLSENFDSKFNYEAKGKQTVKVYSVAYSRKYHELLAGMVERQLRASIKMTGDLWYTAWVDAGQPDLRQLMMDSPTEEEIKKREEELLLWKKRNLATRQHEEVE